MLTRFIHSIFLHSKKKIVIFRYFKKILSDFKNKIYLCETFNYFGYNHLSDLVIVRII